MKQIIEQYQLGSMQVYYLQESDTKQVGLTMLPVELKDTFTLDGNWNIDPLVQIKVIGDSYPDGFSQGHTMRNSHTTKMLQLESHQAIIEGVCTKIVTTLVSHMLRVTHTLLYRTNDTVVSIQTDVENIARDAVTLEALSSCSIGGISALGGEIRSSDFVLHRLRSKWSAEGQLLSENFLDLQLEPAWQLGSVQSVRFGELGSMPVRGYFPWMIIEDTKYAYSLGVQLAHNASWQMEVYCRDAKYACSAGIADREFGHWMKVLQPNERFITPRAFATVALGSVEEISNRLTEAQKSSRGIRSIHEETLPIIFNEFCTTWGFPTEQKMKEIVSAIAGKGFTYCVIDAGWFATELGNWYTNMGDWDINEQLFPGGFCETVRIIKEAGMIPGLWFEMEVVGCEAKINEKSNYLLTRDGVPIQSGVRRFFDLRNPEVIGYLSEKVIGILKQYGFGYLKIDYNDSIGIGCDGSDSLGEGLRQTLEGTKQLIEKIRAEIPDIVIENCSSGGHRLEPSMTSITDMSSFSDAHECVSSPIIAANVTRAIRPEQSQIWAVVRASDDVKRLYYTMSNTFLGRMCISGDVSKLSSKQWNIIEDGIEFYKEVAPIIKDGLSHIHQAINHSYRQPEGYQYVLRKSNDGLLLVVHTFQNIEHSSLEIPLPSERYQVRRAYHREEVSCSVDSGVLTLCGLETYDSVVLHLVQQK